jgi:hypothetical protein
LSDADLQAILGQIGGGMTEEEVLNNYYNQAIAAASAANMGIDAETEQYLRDRAAQYEQAGLDASNATALALSELAGTPTAGSTSAQQALASDIAGAAMAPTGTAVSSLTPASSMAVDEAAATRADAQRAAGNFAAREQMSAEDLAYLSGVAQLMGVEFGQDINRRIEDAIMAEKLAASRASREAQAVLEQQRLSDLADLSQARVKTGIPAVSEAQIEQLVYAVANEWAGMTDQQKMLAANRRGLTGASDSELQQGYIMSRLREEGLVA